MKILLISSSPRKEQSQTYLLADEVIKGCKDFESDAEISLLHLCDMRIEFCHHCEKCHEEILACPIDDDVATIIEKMLAADGIIFASPNYINQITASLKALWDRASHFIHCLRLMEKHVAGVVSSGSGQDKSVLGYIRYYANICGAQYSGGVSSRVPITKDKKDVAFQLGGRLASDIRGKITFPEQTKVINECKDHFRKIIEARKEEWKEEHQYWQFKGWL